MCLVSQLVPTQLDALNKEKVSWFLLSKPSKFRHGRLGVPIGQKGRMHMSVAESEGSPSGPASEDHLPAVVDEVGDSPAAAPEPPSQQPTTSIINVVRGAGCRPAGGVYRLAHGPQSCRMNTS